MGGFVLSPTHRMGVGGRPPQTTHGVSGMHVQPCPGMRFATRVLRELASLAFAFGNSFLILEFLFRLGIPFPELHLHGPGEVGAFAMWGRGSAPPHQTLRCAMRPPAVGMGRCCIWVNGSTVERCPPCRTVRAAPCRRRPCEGPRPCGVGCRPAHPQCARAACVLSFGWRLHASARVDACDLCLRWRKKKIACIYVAIVCQLRLNFIIYRPIHLRFGPPMGAD